MIKKSFKWAYANFWPISRKTQRKVTKLTFGTSFLELGQEFAYVHLKVFCIIFRELSNDVNSYKILKFSNIVIFSGVKRFTWESLKSADVSNHVTLGRVSVENLVCDIMTHVCTKFHAFVTIWSIRMFTWAIPLHYHFPISITL